jgi:nucleotide-binding universal stress UspA family protein
MPTPIIVPLDRSDFAEEALPLAREVADKLHAPLELTLVHSPVPMLPESAPGTGPDLDARIRAEEWAYLQRVARRLPDGAGVPPATAILDGPVAPTLIDHVRTRDAQLVVMTTHGRGGVSRMFLGSVADRLIRGLHCPLLLVHAGHPLTTFRAGERLRILVALDGSALAESVIDQVLAVFKVGEILLELVQVVSPHHDVFVANDAPLGVPTTMEQSLLTANRYLDAVAARLRQLGLEVHTGARIDRSVAHAILQHVESREIELIAVATHGLGGIERVMLGSVADKLVREARIPLFVWNPPAEASSNVLQSTVGKSVEPSGISGEELICDCLDPAPQYSA